MAIKVAEGRRHPSEPAGRRATTRRTLSAIGCAASALMLAVCGSGASNAGPSGSIVGPIQQSWAAAVAYSAAEPDAIPQGINDFSCIPGPEHPRPIVLINGAFESMYANWSKFAPQLEAEGYCVFGLNYGGNGNSFVYQTGPLRNSAREVGNYIDAVLAATGSSKVDLVGHSEGGLVPLYYINRLDGARKVGTMIGIAPVTNGISAYGLMEWVRANPGANAAVENILPAATDATVDSEFVKETAAGGILRPQIRYATVTSRTDSVVQLHESQLPVAQNVRNTVVQDVCPQDLADHVALVYDDITLRLVQNLLDPTTAVEPSCHSVLPFVGAIPSVR